MDENYPVDENDKTTWGFSSEWTSSTNILGLVVFRCSVHLLIRLKTLPWNASPPVQNKSNKRQIFPPFPHSIVTGIAIAACGEEGRPLLDFFTSVSVVMMRVTTWIIYLAPVGVCFLIAGQIIIVSCM